MKILIYGVGVIGCTYGWQLSEAGHHISVLVRKEKKKTIKENGINIHCSDFRSGGRQVIETIFRPEVIDELSASNDFEYIIVPTNSSYLKDILPVLRDSAGSAHILFFQNIWDDFDEIDRYLSAGQYFFGFPFMAGGGKEASNIHTIISGSKYSKTMLGEADGTVTPRVRKMAEAMEKARMEPFLSNQIITWLIPHCVFIACFSAGILQAGGTMNQLLGNRPLLKETLKAIREGFRVCTARGIDPKKEKVNTLYYLPAFISIRIVRNIFSQEMMAKMFEAYLKHGREEVQKTLDDIIACGDQYKVNTPHLKTLKTGI